MKREIRTFSLTLNGETREVGAQDVWGDGKRFMTLKPVGMWQKGKGGKLWAERVNFWLQLDGSYKHSTKTTILNRADYVLVGWSEEITNVDKSKHNSAW